MLFTPLLTFRPRKELRPSRAKPILRVFPVLIGCAALALLAFGVSTAYAYVTEGPSWPNGTVTFQLGLGNAGRTLIDGNTSWNTAAAPALDVWEPEDSTSSVCVCRLEPTCLFW